MLRVAIPHHLTGLDPALLQPTVLATDHNVALAVLRADVHILQIQAAAVAVGYRLIADADALPLLQLLILADEHLEGVIGYIGVSATPRGGVVCG